MLSSYVVGTAGDITTAQFNAFKAAVQTELDDRVPTGISSGMYDILHGLLILDMYEFTQSDPTMQSEKIGEYSYTRAGFGGGVNKYRLKFEQLIKRANRDTDASAGVTRSDYSDTEGERTGGDFKLDQNDFVGFE